MNPAKLVEEIDELLDDDRYAWAFTTLCGIRETIGRTNVATEGQHQAVQNIRNAKSIQQRAAATGTGLPSDKYRTSRRYEGFDDGRKRKDLD